MNAELEATNQALEEKAKALATARLRYKRDNKALQSAIEDAKQKLDQLSAKSNGDSQDPAAQDLKKDMEKLRLLHSKLETMREHRLALEQENKTLFNVVVEKKADLKFKSKKKVSIFTHWWLLHQFPECRCYCRWRQLSKTLTVRFVS